MYLKSISALQLTCTLVPLAPAQTMKERGWMRYSSAEEGELTAERVAAVPEDVDRARVRFMQARGLGQPRHVH